MTATTPTCLVLRGMLQHFNHKTDCKLACHIVLTEDAVSLKVIWLQIFLTDFYSLIEFCIILSYSTKVK
jgi:hypothetical protein